MEEVGPAAPGRRAEIENDLAPFAAGNQSRRLLGGADVASQGNLRCLGGHVARGITDRQLVDHPGNRLVRRQREDGRRGVEDFGEAAARPSPDGRKGVGEPRRGDQVIRRGGEAVAA